MSTHLDNASHILEPVYYRAHYGADHDDAEVTKAGTEKTTAATSLVKVINMEKMIPKDPRSGKK